MELRHIRYFLAIARHQSFTRAAAALGIAQPPLSAQIGALEREIGARLFHRSAQGATLTAAGEAFRSCVAILPSQIDLAVAAAGRAGRGESGRLAVGFTPSSIFNPTVSAALKRFKEAYPLVELTLREANTSLLMADLAEGVIDVALVRIHGEALSPFASAFIENEPMAAVVPARHPLAVQPASVSLDMLRGEALLLFPRGQAPILFDIVVNACRAVGYEPKLGQTTPQCASIINLVSAGFGVAIVPGSMRSVAVEDVVFRMLADGPLAPLSLIWRRGDEAPAVRRFVDQAAGFGSGPPMEEANRPTP